MTSESDSESSETTNRGEDDGEKRNIVMVTIDSLRADYCGFMGHGGGLTPTMDRMATDGLTFTNAVAPGPSTLDAMPVIFTGEDVHDARSDVWERDDGRTGSDDSQRIGDETREQFEHHMRTRETIPERLSRRGYETAAFTANPWTSRYFGFDEGFDEFEDFMDVDREDGLLERTLGLDDLDAADSTTKYALQLLHSWTQETNMFQSWGSFYDDVVSWAESADEPYFIWIFLVDVHMPYLPEPEFRRGSRPSMLASNLWLYLGGDERAESVLREPLLTAYEDTIRYVDAGLEQLSNDLAADDPIYVVHADHGEEFGEHDIYGHGPDVYEEQIHVPMFVGNGPNGVVDRPFSLAELPELLVRLADGDDVTDLGESVVKAYNEDPKMTARGRRWKYIETETGAELYDLNRGEYVEIDEPELRELGQELVESWRESEAERRRLVEASRAVAGEHRL